MSDTFYGLELMAREKARSVEADMQRRQMLRRARSANPPLSRTFLRRFQGGLLIRCCYFLLCCARGSRLMRSWHTALWRYRLQHPTSPNWRRWMISSCISGVRSLK